MEEKMNLADFAKTMNAGEEVIATEVKKVEEPKEEKKDVGYELIDASVLNQTSMVIPKKNDNGIIPTMSRDERDEIKKVIEKQSELHLSLFDKYMRILKSVGYTDEEIKNMPYSKITRLAMAIESDYAEGKIGELKENKNVNETAKIETAVVNQKVEEPVTKVDKVQEEAVEEVKEEEVVEAPEVTLKDVLKENENVYIKYTDKPLNAYRRNLLNKANKILSRQKRGRSVDIYLPNSNIKLSVFEMHQPTVINELFTIENSKSNAAKRKTITTILERSNVKSSDGSEISLDALFQYISKDDIPYIYLAAAVANSVDKIPYRVICDRCKTPSVIELDTRALLAKAIQDIPDSVASNFMENEPFLTQAYKSVANKVAQVIDTEARVVIEIENPSIRTHINMGESTRTHIVEKFASFIPKSLEYTDTDIKFDFLYNIPNVDIAKLITACSIAQYIRSISFYKFDSEEGTEWNDEVNLDFKYDTQDSLDAILEAITSFELSTLNVMEKVIEEEFVKKALSINTGKWICSNSHCKNVQEDEIEGLELLMTSLLVKIQNSI